MSKKTEPAESSTEKAQRLRSEDAAAQVADAQPQARTADPPKAEATLKVPAAEAVDDPYAGFTPSELKKNAARADKAGNKDLATRLTARATLADQQATQKASEKTEKNASRDAIIAAVDTFLTKGFGSGNLQTAAVFRMRINAEPPFAVNATGTKKTGSGDDRAAISALDLTAANVDAFLMPDGSDVTIFATVNNKSVPVHPVTYLLNFAPDSICFYDRACRAGHEIGGSNALKKHTGPQKQGMDEGKGLRHGDAVSRTFASLAKDDTKHSVRLTDGTVITVADLYKTITAAPAA